MVVFEEVLKNGDCARHYIYNLRNSTTNNSSMKSTSITRKIELFLKAYKDCCRNNYDLLIKLLV